MAIGDIRPYGNADFDNIAWRRVFYPEELHSIRVGLIYETPWSWWFHTDINAGKGLSLGEKTRFLVLDVISLGMVDTTVQYNGSLPYPPYDLCYGWLDHQLFVFVPGLGQTGTLKASTSVITGPWLKPLT